MILSVVKDVPAQVERFLHRQNLYKISNVKNIAKVCDFSVLSRLDAIC